MFARVGAIAAHNRKKYKKSPNTHELSNFTKEVKQEKYDILTFNREPIALWTTGLIIFAFGIFLIYNFGSSSQKKIIEYTASQKWWTILVSCMVLILGLVIMLYGVRHKVIIDKTKNLLTIKKSNFICKKKLKTRDLSTLENVVISKEGLENLSTNTIHYKLHFCFQNKESVSLIESQELVKIQKRYIQVMYYLGLPFDIENIPYYDNTFKDNEEPNENEDEK